MSVLDHLGSWVNQYLKSVLTMIFSLFVNKLLSGVLLSLCDLQGFDKYVITMFGSPYCLKKEKSRENYQMQITASQKWMIYLHY